MFTGIVEELGKVKKITSKAGVILLEVSAKLVLSGIKLGDSVAVNGVCLTAVAIGEDSLSFEVIPQTLKNTGLGCLKIGQGVNLERSLKVGDNVSGHFVYGHIDCIGIVRKKFMRNGSVELVIAVPSDFMRYCLPKGSIAIDGISLTLAYIRANTVTVCIIPHTLKNTTLDLVRPPDQVNVEFDILAKRYSS